MKLFKQEPALIVGFVQAVLALVAAFGLGWISPEQAAAIVAFVSAASLLVRSAVYSPATAEQIKEQREILAETVRTADTTGSVPHRGSKIAKEVLGGAVDMVVPPGLINEAVKWGLGQSFVLKFGVEATRLAIAAAKEAAKRAPTYGEAGDLLRAGRAAE